MVNLSVSKKNQKKKIPERIPPPSFKEALVEWGINFLFHLTYYSYVESIFRRGILARSKVNVLKEKVNMYRRNIQLRGERVYRNKYNEDLKNYARLFLVSETPMLRDLLFSFKLYHKMILIPIKPEVMDDLKPIYFTNATCGSPNFKRYESIKDLENLNWNYILNPYEKFLATLKDTRAFDDFKACRGAEILIYDKVPTKYLTNRVYVYSSEAKNLLIQNLGSFKDKIEIIVDHHHDFFPISPKSKQYWKRINYYDSYH